MMGIMVSKETLKIETREGFTLSLPKFIWTVLEKKAKGQNQDVETALNGLVAEVLTAWFIQSIQTVVPLSVN
jgi:hypothetical protein